MFKKNQWLEWIILLIVGGVMGIFMLLVGYVMGKLEKQYENNLQDAVAEIRSLQLASSQQSENVVKRLDNLATKVESFSKQISSITLIAKNQSVKPPSSSEPICPEQVNKNTIDNNKGSTASQTGQQTDTSGDEKINELVASVGLEAIGLTDYKKFHNLVENLFTGELTDKIESIKTIGRIASPEIKQELFEMIQNDEEHLAVRLTAIESLDWKDDANTLANIFNSSHNQEVQQAIISKTRATDFSSEKTAIEQEFSSAYAGNSDESVKLSILEYFSDKNPEMVDQLLSLIPSDKFSSHLRGHIEFVQSMAKQQLQTQESSKDATSSSGK